MRSKAPIRLIIPDTGPLISLAAGDALDLLLLARRDVRIVLTDIVEFEATRRADAFVDGAKIRDFLEVNASRVEIMRTTIGDLALPDMRRRLEIGETLRLPRDLGELSISSCLALLRTSNPGEPTLLLVEDDWFDAHVPDGNVHMVSTSAFLDGLEKAGILASAVEVRAKIRAQRPHFRAEWMIDLQAQKIDEGTEWISQFESPK